METCTNSWQMAKNVSYTGGFIGALTIASALPFAARVLPTILSGLTTDLLVVLAKRLVAVVLLEMHSVCTNMINATEYRNAKAMVSI